MDILIVIVVCSIAARWVLMPARGVLHARKLGKLSAMPWVEPECWPKPLISVIAPALR